MPKLKEKIKQLGLKILLKILIGLVYLKRFGILFLFFVLSGLKPPGKLILEYLIFPIYRLYIFLRRNFFRAPWKKTKEIFKIILPKYAPHLAILSLSALIIGNNISAQIKPPENFGQKNLLNLLVNQDDEVIDNGYFLEEIGPYAPPQQYFKTESYLIASPKEERIVFEEGAHPSIAREGYLAPGGAGFGALPETRTQIAEYIVAPGDTVSAIAERFNVTVNTILWANKLSVRDTLRPGQKLTVPPTSGVLHKIVKNDTLKKIAAKYKTDQTKIIAFNPGAEAGLTVGDVIVVPDGVMPLAATAQPRSIAPASAIFAPSPQAFSGARMIWPTTSRRLTQYFKWNHAGIDIGEPTGSPLYASDEGIVEYAGWGRGGWGNTILINHGDGRKTRYSHASRILVHVGDFVSKGQTIALSGNTGRSTGPHLDFRIYINGRTVNPLDYVR